jgi:type I restriction enzyme S subunit
MITKFVPKLRFSGFSGEGEEKELKKVSSAIFDGTHQTPKYVESGIPFFSVENIISGNKNKFISIKDYNEATKKNKPEKGDILITRIGNIGYSIVVSWSYNFSIYVTLAVIKQSLAYNSFYLHYYLQSSRCQLEILSKSLLSAVPCKINMEELRKIKVLLPKDKKEQQKIANCLSSLDNLIEVQNKKVDALAKYKKGLMQKLFPTNDEKIPRLRFKGFSGEWEENSLIDLAKFRRGSFPQPYGLSKWYDNKNGMPFIQVFDVSHNLQLKDNTKSKISILGAKQSVFIKKGTLIITIQGSIGRVAITQYDAYIDRTLLLFEQFYQKIDKLFFAYILKNLFEIEKEKAPGGIIKTITKEVLSNFIVKLASFTEQQKIADCLSSLDNLIEVQNKNIQILKTHKKGLMQQLFVSENK